MGWEQSQESQYIQPSNLASALDICRYLVLNFYDNL